MPRVPAVCVNCSLVFPSLLEMGGIGDATFSGIGTECPKCGGNAKILDAKYSVFGNSLRILFEQSSEELQVLLDALKEAQRKGASPEEVQESVKEHAPEIASWIRKVVPQNQAQWVAFLGLLIAAITFIKDNLKPNPSETVINNTVIYAASEICKLKPTIKFSTAKSEHPLNRKGRLAQRSRARHK